jgi:Zn-dependent protease with chaperone function
MDALTFLQRLFTGLLLAAGISACTTTSTLPTAVDVDRKQNLVVPQGASDFFSKVYYSVNRSIYQVQGLLNNKDVQYQDQRVQLMFNRLIRHVDAINPGASKWPWEIHVVDRGIVNAFAVGAGKVMVYRGLIERLALSEDELAVLVAHEIGHNLRLHIRESLSNAVPIYAVGVGLSQALTPWSSAMIIDYGVEKPMSRTKEVEADRIGLELVARAGFKPAAAPQVFVKMYEHENMERDALFYQKIIPRSTYLRTHPLSEDRETDVKQQTEKINSIYALSDKYIPADKPLSNKTKVNIDYLDDYEKLYLVGRVVPETLITSLFHASENVSFGTDLGYGWMLKRSGQGGLNLHAGLSYFRGDPQIKGNFGGAFTELGWVFNPQWQVYGRLVSAQDMDNSERKKQKLAAGLRWGNFSEGHLYLEAGQGRALFNSGGPWKNNDLLEFGYAFNFGLF